MNLSKITIKAFKPFMIIFLVYIIFSVIIIERSKKHPKECIIINKKSSSGLRTEKEGIRIYIYPRYEITVTNFVRVRRIHLNKQEFDSLNRWQKYETKHELYMYQ